MVDDLISKFNLTEYRIPGSVFGGLLSEGDSVDIRMGATIVLGMVK
jgi:hypothetical protein